MIYKSQLNVKFGELFLILLSIYLLLRLDGPPNVVVTKISAMINVIFNIFIVIEILLNLNKVFFVFFAVFE